MRPSNRPIRALIPILGVVVGGCATPEVEDDVANAASYTTEAIVLVERTAADGQFVQTNVSAKFMRLATNADPDLAERVVGGSWLDLPAVGECHALAAFAGTDEAPALSGLGSIELLDVGDLSITAESTIMPLATRAFPDVGGLVSGVFYTSRDAQSDLPSPGRYVLESSGSQSIDRFSIGADAPATPENVRVGNIALAEGVSLEESVATTLNWSTAPSRTDGDLVYVDLTGSDGSGVRCTFKDSGEAVLPASATATKIWGSAPAPLTMALHRVRQGRFDTAAIDAVELRFDFSVVGKATIVSASAP